MSYCYDCRTHTMPLHFKDSSPWMYFAEGSGCLTLIAATESRKNSIQLEIRIVYYIYLKTRRCTERPETQHNNLLLQEGLCRFDCGAKSIGIKVSCFGGYFACIFSVGDCSLTTAADALYSTVWSVTLCGYSSARRWSQEVFPPPPPPRNDGIFVRERITSHLRTE